MMHYEVTMTVLFQFNLLCTYIHNWLQTWYLYSFAYDYLVSLVITIYGKTFEWDNFLHLECKMVIICQITFVVA